MCEETDQVRCYKFSAGFNQHIPPEVETLSEAVLTSSMGNVEDLRYYPLILKIVLPLEFDRV